MLSMGNTSSEGYSRAGEETQGLATSESNHTAQRVYTDPRTPSAADMSFMGNTSSKGYSRAGEETQGLATSKSDHATQRVVDIRDDDDPRGDIPSPTSLKGCDFVLGEDLRELTMPTKAKIGGTSPAQTS
ncbi:hypothetical protein GH714_005691 [Hevea brasiliensis]|uniref:Uncharacterized protein n=1 Tax=Hevea brasiliensis TaxID=3981 RepID=A0A6A6M8D2_HEVBR|nr:hypothetical protein GH714_005691 [Hevea brasiliensis]